MPQPPSATSSVRTTAAGTVPRIDPACAVDGSANARYHGVAEEGVPFREIAEIIGRRLKVPVVAKSPEAAASHFGWFAHFAAMDVPASSQKTRDVLGWKPKQVGLIPDLDRPRYFER